MIPYRSGKYVVGNRFLLDLSTGQISFHCRSSMDLLRQQMPADGETTESAVTDDDRLAAFAPAILQALAKDAPKAGCKRAEIDPFWGTSAQTASEEELEAADRDGQVGRVRVVVLAEVYVRRAVEQTEAETQYRPRETERPWTAADEDLYQRIITAGG